MSAGGPSAPRCGSAAVHTATASQPRRPEVSDSAIMIVTSLAVRFIDGTPSAPRWARPLHCASSDVHDDQRTGPGRASLAYSFTNRARSRIRVGGFGKHRISAACTIAVMATPSRQARLYTRRLRNTQSLQSRPGAAPTDSRGPPRLPARTRRSPRPAHWRSDDSPIGSRRTLPTTGRFSSGSRARMPYASRG